MFINFLGNTIMEMFISSYYSKVLVPCLLSVNSHSSPQFSFGFTYIEFSTIRANNCVYKIHFHESSPSVKKCTDKRCMTCPSLIEGTSFTFKNGRTFTVMQDILYSGNILKCPPEQSWKCSLALIIVRSWCLVCCL
jgi:hypothetical protein